MSAVEGRQHDRTEWAVVLPDGSALKLWDAPFGLLGQVAAAHKIADVSTLVDQPLAVWAAGADLYRRIVKDLGQKPEPTLSVRDLRSRYREVEADAKRDDFSELVADTFARLADSDGEVDSDTFLEELRARLDAQQWAVVLPDGVVVKMWDLEWALLSIVAERHATTVDRVLDRPRHGSGAFVADLYASICENQRQPGGSTDGKTFGEVVELFRLVDDDKPTVDQFTDTGTLDPKSPAPDGATTG